MKGKTMKFFLKTLAVVALAALAFHMLAPDAAQAAALGHGASGLTVATFAAAGLRRMAYGGFLDAANSTPVTYHSYVTNDTLATVLGADYFDTAYSRLAVQDIIHLHYDMDGAPGYTQLRVTASASGGVDVVQEGGGGQVASDVRTVYGQATTVAASDTIVTGLATVQGAIAVLDDDPVDGVMQVSASIGDQDGAPAAGSILIKSWKSTDGDATPIAGTTFGKKVNWIAWGT
jgi:hypothetical protein